jgi:catechol 2,3-dioxygenase-like lactoylglutathione lyase family enzyme
VGLNHISFWVPSKLLVDVFYKEYLLSHSIRALYGAPKRYDEYRQGYYAVYFEDPDRLKLEVMTAPSFNLRYKEKRELGLPKH